MSDARPFSRQFRATSDGALIEALAASAPLSKSLLKKVLAAGGVWLRKGGGKWRRVRRAQLDLAAGDEVALYFDPAALAVPAVQPLRLWSQGDYSVYYKPPGMPTQPTRAGDRADLMYLITSADRRPTFTVHRLDTAAAGVLLVAHTSRAAGLLSGLLQARAVRKRYQAQVVGTPPSSGSWSGAIDGKPALTHFWTLRSTEVSDVLIDLDTGRHHQIRRHFAEAGHPLVGDKRYGGPAAPQLALVAVELQWRCPFSGTDQAVELPAELRLFAETSPPA